VKLQLPPEPRKVFYNPRMSINRDFAMLFAGSYFSPLRQLRLCDPMAGSGVRAARYLLEVPNVAHVVAADRDQISAILAQETLLLNGMRDRFSVVQSDAHRLLSDHTTDRFDIIDLDPFGSPTAFFEPALRATTDGGVIAATATDMGPLSGARPTACMRKYGVSPVRTEFEKELAIRTLASSLVTTATKLELGINLAFSHATDHYARLYAVVSKGRKEANQSIQKLGYVAYCKKCLFRSETQPLSSIQNTCPNCGSSTSTGGPYWLGPLWDKGTVESMVKRASGLASFRLSDVQKILGLIEEELDSPMLYYTTDTLASVYKTKPPSLAALVPSLARDGYQVSRTHFNPTGFRTNAPVPRIAASFRNIAKETQP